MSKTLGIDHLGLTVSDLTASLDFFVNGLGWEKAGGNSEYPSAYIGNGHSKVTLWQQKGNAQRGFDRHANVGLHHTALKIPDSDALHALFDRIKDWPGVVVEFGPELSGKGSKEHFMIYEPGGTRLEFSFDPR